MDDDALCINITFNLPVAIECLNAKGTTNFATFLNNHFDTFDLAFERTLYNQGTDKIEVALYAGIFSNDAGLGGVAAGVFHFHT